MPVEAIEVCNVCSIMECEVYEKVFVREGMSAGYNLLASIPAGACNVTLQELAPTHNFLALKWNAEKKYFLNGNWMKEKSGNYTAKGNTFSYHGQDTVREKKAVEDQIIFTSQLSHKVDVYIVFKEKNPGILLQYVLPPIKKGKTQAQDKNRKKSHFCSKTVLERKKNNVFGRKYSPI